MAYVVTEACIKCKFTDCVDVCPVDCFREGRNFLVIDPEECIDCTLCVPECPVEAIFAEDDVPEKQRAFIALNAELAKQWPAIIERKEPPADADDWKGVRTNRASWSAEGYPYAHGVGSLPHSDRGAVIAWPCAAGIQDGP